MDPCEEIVLLWKKSWEQKYGLDSDQFRVFFADLKEISKTEEICTNIFHLNSHFLKKDHILEGTGFCFSCWFAMLNTGSENKGMPMNWMELELETLLEKKKINPLSSGEFKRGEFLIRYISSHPTEACGLFQTKHFGEKIPRILGTHVCRDCCLYAYYNTAQVLVEA